MMELPMSAIILASIPTFALQILDRNTLPSEHFHFKHSDGSCDSLPKDRKLRTPTNSLATYRQLTGNSLATH